MRLEKHPVLEYSRKKKITINYEGKDIVAYEGEPIAAALHAAGIADLSDSFKFARPRGLFCAIGKCASCIMEVDGVPNVRTCIEPVKEGMVIKKQSSEGLNSVDSSDLPDYEEGEIIETDFAIIGGGPAGLSAAVYAARFGVKSLIIEENFLMGGQLIKQTHKFFGSRSHYASVRGIDIAHTLIDEVEEKGVEVWTSSSVVGYFPDNMLGVVKGGKYCRVKAKTILVATGASEKIIPFPGNDIPGVYGAGAIQTLMNVYGIVPGKKVLMVGAGNIGVIVAYQLLQAGVEVVGVCEGLPRVGAYVVHSAKLKRLGVPIYTSHTLSKVWGDQRVEGAEVVALDEKWNRIPGTEKSFDIDTVGLAVGLSPSVELLAQAGAAMTYIPELGGHICVYNENMETTIPGVYIAGDIAGIEEASAAMMEGRIAGLSAAEKIVGLSDDMVKSKAENLAELKGLREGPFGVKIREGNEKLLKEARKYGLC